MGKRIVRTGLDLLMETQRICSREIMKLPREDRESCVEWLRRSVVPRPEPTNGVAAPAPEVPDPRQEELPLEAPPAQESAGFE